MVKYWIVSGELASKFLLMLRKRDDAIEKLEAFAKKLNGTIGMSDSLGITTAIYFKGPIPEGWKKVKGNNCYQPKENTKEGKALAEEISLMEKDCPSRGDFGALLGLEPFVADEYGIHTNTVRHVGQHGKRIVLATPDDFDPSNKVAKDLKRISDLEFEKLIKLPAARTKKGKSK